jgi:Flp pilus assembly protein TadG
MKRVFKFVLRFAHCSSGSALMEMTLIIPVTISLMVGAVDFAMALATLATGGKSVHDAARYLASLPATAVCGGTPWGVTNAKKLAVYGNTAGTGNPLISGWSTTNVTVTYTSGCTSSPLQAFNITVTASIPYSSIIVAGFLPMIASTYTMSATHQEASLAWFL